MRGTPLRVLLVEDSENDALLLLRELRRGGYEPLYERVSTPEEMERALEEARKRGKPWEVVLSDYYMPRFRGPDALDLLRGLGYDTPFVVVSGKIGEDAAVAMMRAGAQDYVAKENLARLCPAIERELREAEGRRERERAEEALRDSEGRYRVVAETASDAIILIDEDSRMLVINGAAEKIFGYARAEMIGQRLTMLMPERLRGAHEASLRHYVETGRRRLDWGSIQLLGLHKSGREIPIEVSFGEFVRDGKRFFTGFVRDMTERKETEKRLREAETRYRTFIGQSTEGIWRFELEEPLHADLPEGEQIERFYRHGYLAECNDAMARMYGYERAEEIVGARLADLLPSSIPENVEYLEAFVRSGYRMVDAESFEVDREGNARYFLNNLTGIVEDGSLVRAWGTQREVTERKRFEEELRESEERFRATFEQAAAGVAHVSLEGRWLRVNQKLSEIVGYSGEELLRMTFQDITHGDDLETDLEQVCRLLAGEIDTYSMEKRYIRKDGSIVWINLTASLVRDIEGPPKYFIAVIEDITERKRAEDERSRLAAIVESSDDAILGKTLEGIITSWNRAAERLYGYSVEEAVGQPVSILVPPDRPMEVP